MNTDNAVSQALQVAFEPGQTQPVAIELDEKTKKKLAAKLRAKERLENRAAYERMGIRVLKLKTNTYRMLQSQIAELGIKTIGHCSIMIAREKAEAVVAELDAIAQQWDENGEAVNPEVRMHLQQLKLECIKVMVESGAEHLRAERQPTDRQPVSGIQLPFEAGMPTAIIYGKPPTPAIEGGNGTG